MTDKEKQAKKEYQKKVLQKIKGLCRWTIAGKSKKWLIIIKNKCEN